MLEILTNQEIIFGNVVSYRGKIKQSQFNEVLTKMIKLLEGMNVNKEGPLITTTFNVESVGNENVFDMEILIPIDKKIELPKGYVFKDVFHLVHAISTRYIGDPIGLQDVYNQLIGFISRNKLQPITTAYNVYINDTSFFKGEPPVIDVYIGINPSKI
ncbi:Transcriptional regulator, effector-binding domain/component [Anoxybacillus ayderensis]|uniref:Transcriptional regulator, effector-binding domain/component n=1 Tax=Anoxybacillus ayderensis TaxID=265546 RepID=A0A0D0GZF4_9BACL|nr:GyrI-like domain-containing protein [Anoxybacillus ayderensis]EPZ37559.1 transcriptional regulator, effector-binding domain/component [Anoxybacillus ayderensis]KHF28972.1 Bacterial transcription activator, effector binding domain [Anoxybacillus sp. BCO1]KIP21241.1 Transcriptional regulator, effector-binding domain/component [Anoxybacillus ayderensis]